ncbi:ABC transporter ATP-binding protein [Gulosibacter molinativorax]|uniref:ABC transporter ATP-binding protein n=1 Tax=Gulosibacter molinativorax TaxID=256821 RepID=A0ABT7C9I2_9MICO|nr:ABC transporter ATP-binding protein [Gulosibacter molinativorax]MDJ1371855.1 ABC transporter ATP-binding protein [Gulosibacter molinativorax]QUY60773.1 ABC transporter, NBP/MSD fusion protein [Gulosibacter molinativorax]
MSMMPPGAGGGRGGGRPPAFRDESELRSQNSEAPEVENLWRKIGALFTPYRGELLLSLVLVLVTAALGVLPALLTQQAFDRGLFPVGGGGPNLVALWWVLAAMVAVLILNSGLSIWQSWLTALIGNSVTADLRIRLFDKLQQMELAFFARTKTGEIQSRLQNDVGGVATTLQNTFTSVIGNVVATIASIAAMFVLNWQLAILSLIIMPPLVAMQRRVGQRRARVATKTQQSLADMTAMTQESLSVSGILLTKTLGREESSLDQYRVANREQVRLQRQLAMMGQWFFGFMRVVMGLVPVVIYLVAGFLIAGGTGLTAGTIVAFTSVNSQMTRPLTGLMRTGLEIQTSKALFARIFEYLGLKPAIEDSEEPKAPNPDRAGEVEFDHVSFRYPDQSKDEPATLSDVSFTVHAGEMAAFVGPSGAGKSTISYLAARLYDATEGTVRFAGVDVRDLRRSEIMRHIGLVSQESYLVHATIAENLRLAKPEASMSELEEACRKASIHEQIMSFPNGYETIVGERGYRLSGGEKQRIAIARVLLKDPPVLILDEATSALDTVSERHVQEAIDEASRGRTVISIAHRLSTIRHADVIHVLDRGRIVERGTHEELLGLGGHYADLYREQDPLTDSAHE